MSILEWSVNALIILLSGIALAYSPWAHSEPRTIHQVTDGYICSCAVLSGPRNCHIVVAREIIWTDDGGSIFAMGSEYDLDAHDVSFYSPGSEMLCERVE